MGEVDIRMGEDERDKKDREYVDMFEEHVLPKYATKPKGQHVDSGAQAHGTKSNHWTFKVVSRSKLCDYGLEPVGDEAMFAICRRGDEDAWRHKADGPTGTMVYGRCERNDDRARVVDAGVYFNHLPGGFKQFPNKRAARAYVQRVHGADLNL